MTRFSQSRARKLYSTTACEELINMYLAKGGEAETLEEGSLGLGLMLLKGQGLKTCVIREVYLNEWSSAHKVRFYNSCPQKYKR